MKALSNSWILARIGSVLTVLSVNSTCTGSPFSSKCQISFVQLTNFLSVPNTCSSELSTYFFHFFYLAKFVLWHLATKLPKWMTCEIRGRVPLPCVQSSPFSPERMDYQRVIISSYSIIPYSFLSENILEWILSQ